MKSDPMVRAMEIWFAAGGIILVALAIAASVDEYELCGLLAGLLGFWALCGLPFAIPQLIEIRRHAIIEKDLRSWDCEARPLDRNSQEATDICHEIAVLNFCTTELKKRIELQGSDAWIWKTKLKVAVLMNNVLRSRIDWEPDLSLNQEDEIQISAEHPLLRKDDLPPPDPSKRYAHQQWFRGIQAKVERFTKAQRQRSQ